MRLPSTTPTHLAQRCTAPEQERVVARATSHGLVTGPHPLSGVCEDRSCHTPSKLGANVKSSFKYVKPGVDQRSGDVLQVRDDLGLRRVERVHDAVTPPPQLGLNMPHNGLPFARRGQPVGMLDRDTNPAPR